MSIRYLTYNEILDAYREQIRIFGGLCAIRDNNALLSIVANPRREFAGTDLYPTIASKAAISVFSIINNNPFADGNKRTAFICGRLFLRLNGYDLTCEHVKFKDLILKIASGQASLDDIREWLELNIGKKKMIEIKVKEREK